MLNKYIVALIASIVFGILIGIMAVIPCLIIFSFILMVILGAVTVHLARGSLRDTSDAIMASGFAGCISGVVGAIVATAGLAALVLLEKVMSSEEFTPREFGSGVGIYGLCCAPVLIVTGVLLAGIGGYVYYEMVAKKTA
jgi:hypothetical protein